MFMKMYIYSLLISGVFFVNYVQSAILRKGNPLKWNDAKPYLKHVRKSGVKQFLNHYNRVKDIKSPKFFWGDELEYGIFQYNKNINSYDLSLQRGVEIQEYLEGIENNLLDLPAGCLWQPEYGSWMVETVPRNPYDGYVSTLLLVEKSMQLRRKRLHAALNDNEIAPSVTTFPLLGVPGLSHSVDNSKYMESASYNNISLSSYVLDSVINPHPRFGTLTANIRSRKGRKVSIEIPIEDSTGTDHIHMDAMCFGMGSCCLQITMQCNSDRESRFLHDQLAIVAPLFLALSAGTPVVKGCLANQDVRWDIISQSVDDRTAAELGESYYSSKDDDLAGGGVKRINKSRYSSVSRFIGKTLSKTESLNLDKLNDIDANIDEDLFQYILEDMNTNKENTDINLAKHLAHLFIRDPLVIFDDAIYLDDNKSLDHFENIQSTNWRTIRWKTPALNIGLESQRRKSDLNQQELISEKYLNLNEMKSNHDDIIDVNAIGPGWRVEFRPLEIQLTDFENAAYSILVVLLSRALLAMGYNFYLPLSYVEENMRRALLKDSVLTQKFYFRKQSFDVSEKLRSGDNIRYVNVDDDLNTMMQNQYSVEEGCLVPSIDNIEVVELTIDEIFNGIKPNHNKDENLVRRNAISNAENFIGIIPAVMKYLYSLGTNDMTLRKLKRYLELLSLRASGKLPTNANFIRKYVKNHVKYTENADKSVPVETISDLLKLCNDIGIGKIQSKELFNGLFDIEKLCPEDVAETYLSTNIKSNNSISNQTVDHNEDVDKHSLINTDKEYKKTSECCCQDNVNDLFNLINKEKSDIDNENTYLVSSGNSGVHV